MDKKPFSMEEFQEKLRRYSGTERQPREQTSEEKEYLRQQMAFLQETQRKGELRQFLEKGRMVSDE